MFLFLAIVFVLIFCLSVCLSAQNADNDPEIGHLNERGNFTK